MSSLKLIIALYIGKHKPHDCIVKKQKHGCGLLEKDVVWVGYKNSCGCPNLFPVVRPVKALEAAFTLRESKINLQYLSTRNRSLIPFKNTGFPAYTDRKVSLGS